ncbi:pyruvate dehydrogenase complex dihydrolipoamide acetyltransferase [Ruficoccus amylovorans]|uniref:Acetyltransferase component of pyruvate dehydrogenase complex n=1 Tax=Ruficoccus amylovorans TaxID=1804625 RepID=A0A842HGJ6_9BACT|nr:pyruvate dehydrogenase complex dihydrolipoamide acetyltransferase [Ruficoccus amylovorans]MBC2594674.1 pyruvate dehydrogenase complex dihydrolipoamide acetyltransferase [Ruficoccus amylovorans]
MAEIIEMPKLSDTMTVGTLVNWLKKEGDEVASGDMICEVETDKATMEVECFVDGVILKHYVPEGGEIPVGAPMCAVGQKGEEPPAVDTEAIADKAEALKKEEDDSGEKPAEKPEEAPTEPAPAQPSGSSKPQPEGRKQEFIPEDEESSDAPEPTEGGRIKVSPLARKLAEQKNIPLTAISGTGPGGRIVKKDVLKAIEEGVKAPAAQSSKPSASSAAPAQYVPAGARIAEEGPIKVTNMRKAIASRLVESKTTIPHFYLEIEVDAAPLLQLRAEINHSLSNRAPEEGGLKLTVNDFILKASTEALRRVPGVNASWMGDHIQQHGAVHMAFGVAVPDGLVTPVIRDAHAKTLRQYSIETKELIQKARNKKLTPNEMSGSTFTVTNLGMYGINSFLGIINPPNAAILSVGATLNKPVVDKSGNITAGQRMMIGLSCDHRVIDGATGAEFLQALQAVLETPALMLV